MTKTCGTERIIKGRSFPSVLLVPRLPRKIGVGVQNRLRRAYQYTGTMAGVGATDEA